MSTSLLALGFVALVAAVAAGLLLVVARAAAAAGWSPARRRTAVLVVGGAIAAWLAITAGLAGAGALGTSGATPPRVIALPPIAIGLAVLALRSAAGRALVAAGPRRDVVALQVFRVPVELLLWALYAAGQLPVQMTFEGRNFDVVTGATALLAAAAFLGSRPRPRLAAAWHVGGLVLLANIVAIAVLSMPGPQRVFTAEPANTLVLAAPWIWLPAFLVPTALVLHVVGLAQLRRG